jgi:hypothetical protein
MVCWQKDGDPLKAWNNKVTGGGNKPCYVWASYLSTPSPYWFTKGRATDLERSSRGDYRGGYEPIKDIDLPPPWPPLRLPSRTGNLNLESKLNATHRLLNLVNPPLAGDCWLCLSLGPLHYIVTLVSLLNQNVHDTISGPPELDRFGLTHCWEGRALPFPKWRMLFLCESFWNSQRYASELQDQVTHRRQELANSWNWWSSIWNWTSCYSPCLALFSCSYWHWYLVLAFFFFYYSYVHTTLGSFLPHAPNPSITTHPTPSLSPPHPQYLAEVILPLSLILL